jgi:serine/threonine-protein kinase RsbW
MQMTASLAPRLPRRGTREGFRVTLPAGPESASRARAAVGQLRADLDAPLVENLRLLVTELVTNCVRHTDSEKIKLIVVVAGDRVRAEVQSPGPAFKPQLRLAGGEHESGWGLFLVERLSEHWGVLEDHGNTRVWFELLRS